MVRHPVVEMYSRKFSSTFFPHSFPSSLSVSEPDLEVFSSDSDEVSSGLLILSPPGLFFFFRLNMDFSASRIARALIFAERPARPALWLNIERDAGTPN